MAGRWLGCGWVCGWAVAGLWPAPPPGQPLELASFRKTFVSSTRNKCFWRGPPKPIISPTRNDHFQNSIFTPAVYDPSPASPTAPSEVAGKINMRPSAVECVFFTPQKKTPTNTPLINLIFLPCPRTFSEIRPRRAGPGPAKRSQAGQGLRLERLPASRSIRQASKKPLFRLRETDAFAGHLQNCHFTYAKRPLSGLHPHTGRV